ncbi:MAG: HepT-like ribonuclease domain-containing protein [Methylovirgula sp.]
MPSRSSDPQRWLIDIRHNIYLARSFVEGLGYEAFRDNQLVFYAVTRCLEIISEASCRLPAELKARHPAVPWVEMAGAGNVYRHDYEDVLHRLVWGTVQIQLPVLLAAIEQEIDGLPKGGGGKPK